MNNHSPLVSIVTEVYDKDGNLKQPSGATTPIETNYSVGLTVKSAEGNIISEQVIPFKSYLGNFTHLMNASFNNVDSSTLIKKVADNSAIGSDVTKLDCTGPISTATQGIVIGFNSAASAVSNLNADAKSNVGTTVAQNDYALKCQILHHATYFEYAAQTYETYSFGVPTITFKRTFKNNSANPYTIGEVGFMGASGVDSVLLCRDVVKYDYTALDTVVAAGATLEVKYIFALNTVQNGSLFNMQTAACAMFTINYLSMLMSDMNSQVSSFVSLNGTSLVPLDISANQGYKDCLAGSTVETYGLLVGYDDTFINPTYSDFGFGSNQNTTLTHGATSAISFSVNSPSVASPHGIVGNKTLISTSFGFQRDFVNETASAINVNKTILAMKGSAAGLSTSMALVSGGFPVVNLAAGETLRLKLYMYFPIHAA